MIKTKIVEVDKYNYKLEDNNGINYVLNIEFYDLKKHPSVGDYIYIFEELLKEPNLYNFGPIIDINNYKKINQEDLIKVVSNNEEFYLQRYYG